MDIKILNKILQIEFNNLLKLHMHHVQVVFIPGVQSCLSRRKSISHAST